MFRLFISVMMCSFWGQSVSATTICNGSERLCSKTYSEVTYLTTHNSFNYSWRGNEKTYGPLGYWFPNQERPIQDQLNEGVRAFMLDLHWVNQELVLCHGGKACSWIGKDSAISVFADVQRFMAQNPGEVITFIFESYASTRSLMDSLIRSGLYRYLHVQKKGQSWPTLGEMIRSGKRLVILNDRVEQGDPDWNHDLFSLAIETNYSYPKPADLNCDFNRGDPGNDLFILNHFTTLISGKKQDAKKINRYETLFNRAIECAEKAGKRVNFLTVDFYRSGDALRVVGELNQDR